MDDDDREVGVLAGDQLRGLRYRDGERRDLVTQVLEHPAERSERGLVLVGEQDREMCFVPRADHGGAAHASPPSSAIQCNLPRSSPPPPARQRPSDPAPDPSSGMMGLGFIEVPSGLPGAGQQSTDRRSQAAVVTAEDRASRTREDRRLLLQYHEGGDPAARDALVQRFLPLARQLARRYQRGGEPLDDLVQVASLGLLKAIDRFDPQRETAFSSFAVPTILGELKRHFRDKGWSVRVPRDLQELAVKVDRVGDQMGRELGRAPTPVEIAESIGVSAEQVLEAREAAGAYRAVSLDRPRDDDDEDGAGIADSVGIDDPGFSVAEDAATVERLMRVLGEREREVLRLRFEEDLTQSEIGVRVGVSQMHVSRLIRQSVARLRELAESDGRGPAA